MGKLCFLAVLLILLPSLSLAQDGKALYDKNCSQCHGLDGAGKGPAWKRLKPEPRDFTSGKFKIRSTPSGALPTDADLVRIIRLGMPYTSMPAWPQFTDDEVNAIVDYLKTFIPESDSADVTPMDLPSAPPWSAESAQRGAQVYSDFGCASCHGDSGRGDGNSAPTLKHESGQHLRPADLTKPWTFRGGPHREDIFRAISTGLNGTPMPSYDESLNEEQRWDLVDYIISIGSGSEAGYTDVIKAKKLTAPVSLDNPDLFNMAEMAYVPVVGQIIEPGREFYPSANGVEVRAVYNETDIAIELRWSDIRADTTGMNGPALEAPRFEDDPYGGAKEEAPTADDSEVDEEDPWGDATADEEEDPWGDETAEDDAGDDLWGDSAAGESATLTADNEFSDAVALQFPSKATQGFRKPYFLFGADGDPVDLWFHDLARDEPELFIAQGSANLESRGPRDLESRAVFKDGQWIVVFKRPLLVRGEAPFEPGQFVPVAFSIWDGFNRERGNKRGLSTWSSLYLEEEAGGSPVADMVQAALLVLALEFILIVWIRRRGSGE